MIIHQPIKNIKDNLLKVEFPIEFSNNESRLYYELEKEYEPLVDFTCDAALVALLIPAMKNGEDIIVNGDISQTLAAKIDSGLIQVINLLIPNTHEIKIEFKSVIKNNKTRTASGVATGFSGGVDSYAVIKEYTSVRSPIKLTHLLFNNVGSHGNCDSELFNKRHSRLIKKATEIGLPFIKVNSNLDHFYSKSINFQQTHTIRNASVALLLQNGISKFLYASAYQYKDMEIGENSDSAYMDTMLLSLVESDKLTTLGVGSKYTRVQKTELISTYSQTYSSLDVCVSTKNNSRFNNCGSCWKCMRTLLTLDIFGKINLYDKSFDLDKYYSKKHKYINKVFSSDDKLLVEIVKLSKHKKFQIPITARILDLIKIRKIKFNRKKLKNVIFKNRCFIIR